MQTANADADTDPTGRAGQRPRGLNHPFDTRGNTMSTIKQLILAALLALSATAAFAAGKVDINRASAAEIAAAMNGIGLAKAEAIVAYRSENGPFKSIDQLAEVKGVGLKTVEKNREVIEVRPSKPAAKQAS
ncbi:helix-hairpin-helix domain-containing protein [Lysobacter sp. CAU 1642]|uniref:Helix-hairpin-helix domain-containing protein n=2 Tax=Pseudomarimonas salicorniae TaxID=2933270 RepID=A0ABT0GHN8_9GAMM|nr:helix-hairpin-helix domain-containing protein [Lysobacter sp. CAU 1642]